MFAYQNELDRAAADTLRKKHIENQLSQLYPQRDQLGQREADLSAIRYKEEDDVRHLSGGSLTALFYSLIGKKEEKLEKEQAEAREAAVRHDAVAAQLQAVLADIDRLEDERRKLLGSESTYRRLLEEKAEAIKNQPGEHNHRLAELDQLIQEIHEQRRETQEAFSAGEAAANLITDIGNELRDAHSWGTFDLLGGGLISDMIKHDHMDKAQNMVNNLQILLRRYHNELADISLALPSDLGIDSFLRFADYFFDGLIADWTVLGRIEESQNKINHTDVQIRNLQAKLKSMLAGQQNQLAVLEEEKRQLIQQW